MKTLLLAVALTLTGCGGYCTTDYGMHIMGLWPNGELPDDFECAKYNTIENKMVDYLAYSRGAGGPERLNGYQVWLRPVEEFDDPYGRYKSIGGFTACSAKQIHIGTSRTVFAHEIAHALQNCIAPATEGSNLDPDHANWVTDGILDIIERASP